MWAGNQAVGNERSQREIPPLRPLTEITLP